MTIKLGYKIVEFDEISASILVQPDNGYPSINIQLPIVNGKFIIGEELDKYIQGFLPHSEVQRASDVAELKDSLNIDDIKSIVLKNKIKSQPAADFALNNSYIQIGDKIFNDKVNTLLEPYPEVDYDLVAPIIAKYWKGLTVEPYIREKDAKLVGIVVTSMTGVLGHAVLLEVRDLQKVCANSGIPLFGFVVSSLITKDQLTTFMGTFGGKSISGVLSNFVYDEYTVSMAKKRKHKLISKERDIELTKGFSYGGLNFACDSNSTSSLVEAISSGKIVPLPTDYSWRSINNIELNVKLSDLEAMLRASQQFKYSTLKRSWLRKSQLESATTFEQISKI